MKANDLPASELEDLRRKLQMQRLVIAQQLHPQPQPTEFPRSHTMRLLLAHPRLVASIAQRIFGVRTISLASAALMALSLTQTNGRKK